MLVDGFGLVDDVVGVEGAWKIVAEVVGFGG